MPACRLVAYWGRWFVRIGDGDMKETNLNIFYHFGDSLSFLAEKMAMGVSASSILSYMIISREWLEAFLAETKEFDIALKDTRTSAQAMLDTMIDIYTRLPRNWDLTITQDEVRAIVSGKMDLEKNFEREHRNLSVFTVTAKGLLDTRLLITGAEGKFSQTTRAVFSPRVVCDLRQAGKCLAFEVPTAMAFHVMRATESLIKGYYEVLAGKPWPYAQRDWGKYITELEKYPDVSKVITSRLTEIKNLNRNPLIHPEEIIPPEEAPIIFDLCNGVIYYMAEEIRKRKP